MKKLKKVLFVATVASHIKGFHEPYLKLLHDKGYKVYAAAKNNLLQGEKINYCDKFIDISIERSPYKLSNLKAVKQLKMVIDEEKFDIIHCHTPMGAVATRLAAREARKKYHTRVIYTAHGFHFFKGAPIINWLMFYPVEKYLAKYTDTLITINKEDFELANKKFSKRCKDIQYVPGVGIDEEKFKFEMTDEEKLKLRKSLGLKKDDFVMIYPARLDKNKNQGFLINVMEKLVKEHNNIHLLLPGNDELNGLYQNMAKEKGLEKNIHFLGYRKDIPQLLKISNVAVSSSKREGLPVNIIESLCVGLPIVALKCRGMEDLIENGKNGWIVENNKNSVEIFSEYINDLFCSNNSLEESKTEHFEYGVSNLIKKYNDFYSEPKGKRILFNMMSLGKGGAERVISLLANSFIEENQVMIVTNINGPIAYQFDDRIKIRTISKYENGFLRKLGRVSLPKLFRLKRLVLDYKPDIIISFLPEPCFRILALKKHCKKIKDIPVIISVRNDPAIEYANKLFYFIMKKLYPYADEMVLQTNDAKQYFIDNIGFEGVVIPNPVSDAFLCERYEGERTKEIVTVGRLEKQKNHFNLIDAFEIVSPKHPDYCLKIYGEGALHEELQKYIDDKHLEDKAFLMGQTDNVKEAIYKAAMFVLSSDYEGMPNALLEAACAGVPCVSTDCPCGGARDILQNGEGGVLVPIGDSEALADGMNKVIENLDYSNMISQGSNSNGKTYEKSLIIDRWKKLLNK